MGKVFIVILMLIGRIEVITFKFALMASINKIRNGNLEDLLIE